MHNSSAKYMVHIHTLYIHVYVMYNKINNLMGKDLEDFLTQLGKEYLVAH